MSTPDNCIIFLKARRKGLSADVRINITRLLKEGKNVVIISSKGNIFLKGKQFKKKKLKK